MKKPTCQCRRRGFEPRVRKHCAGEHGYPLQYSCLENLTDRGTLWATVHIVTKSRTQQRITTIKKLDNRKEYRISSICFSYFCVKEITHNLICIQLFHIFYYYSIFVWYAFVLSCLSKIRSPYLTFTLRSVGFLMETGARGNGQGASKEAVRTDAVVKPQELSEPTKFLPLILIKSIQYCQPSARPQGIEGRDLYTRLKMGGQENINSIHQQYSRMKMYKKYVKSWCWQGGWSKVRHSV